MVEKDAAIAGWLAVIAAMIVIMVALGGITRLTDSGLSIMEWNPILGALPPLNEAEWDRLFSLYRGIAEYKHVNPDMTLAGFKAIFWWEYLHRLWGRLIGIAFLLPFLYFLYRRRITGKAAGKFAIIFALGAAQGALGWFMVASGFEDRIDVSQYRLVAHLLLAAFLFAAILDTAIAYGGWAGRSARPAPAALCRAVHGLGLLVFIQIALGGLVAGTDSGFLYNDFPLMNGDWLSPDLWRDKPWWRHLGDNPALTQFQHRLLALLILILGLWLFAYARKAGEGEGAGLILGALLLQIGLGIATLILVVPLPLAALHQIGAFLLMGSIILFRRRIGT